MSNRILHDYLDDVERQLRHLPERERRSMLAEIRAHLNEDIYHRREADSSLSLDEATLQATTAFGHPSELAVASTGSARVVRRRTGEVLLTVASRTGRGVGKVLKWTVVSTLIVVGLVVLGTVAILAIFQDDIREAVPRPIYSKSDQYQAKTAVETEGFEIGPSVKEFRIQIRSHSSAPAGCLTLKLTNPDGVVVFDNTGSCGDLDQMLTFTRQGTWKVSYQFTAYSGRVSVEAYQFENA